MIPTANDLLAAQGKRANSLKALLPAAIAKHGPSTSAQLHARHGGEHNEKYVSGLLCCLVKSGVLVRLALENDSLRLGGPRKWVFGLAGKIYPGWRVVVGGRAFCEQVFDMVSTQPATAEDVGVEFNISTKAASATLYELRKAGRINRVGFGPQRDTGGMRPFMYGINPEFVPGPRAKLGRPRNPDTPRKPESKVVHIPDPARIAGRIYMRQYANWGMWR